MGGGRSWYWGTVGDGVRVSHGQSSGLGGGRLRSLHGSLAVLPPHQLVGLEQALVAASPAAGAAVRERQHSWIRCDIFHRSKQERRAIQHKVTATDDTYQLTKCLLCPPHSGKSWPLTHDILKNHLALNCA